MKYATPWIGFLYLYYTGLIECRSHLKNVNFMSFSSDFRRDHNYSEGGKERLPSVSITNGEDQYKYHFCLEYDTFMLIVKL